MQRLCPRQVVAEFGEDLDGLADGGGRRGCGRRSTGRRSPARPARNPSPGRPPTRRHISRVSSKHGTSRPLIGTSCMQGVITGRKGRASGSASASSPRHLVNRAAASGPSSRNSAHWPSNQVVAATTSLRPSAEASARRSIASRSASSSLEGRQGQGRVHQPAQHHLVGIAELLRDRERLRAQRPMPIGAALPAVQPGQPEQCPGASPGRAGGAAARARSTQRAPSTKCPRSTQNRHSPAASRIALGGSCATRPAQRGAEIVVLQVDDLGMFGDDSVGVFGVVRGGEFQVVARSARPTPVAPRPPVPGSPGRTAGPAPAGGTGTRRWSVRPTPTTCPPAGSTVRAASVRSSGGPQQIASRAGRVKLPANTAIRRSRTFSRSVSRSWLHSRVARMVWCRVMPTGPCPSTASASPRRCTISAGSSTAIRAAASSSASGMPSSRRHRSTMPWALSASSANPGRTCAARSTNSRTEASCSSATRSASATTPGAGSVSDGTRKGELTRRLQRLPAGGQHVDPGAAGQHLRRPDARRPSSRCSQLSSTISSA